MDIPTAPSTAQPFQPSSVCYVLTVRVLHFSWGARTIALGSVNVCLWLRVSFGRVTHLTCLKQEFICFSSHAFHLQINIRWTLNKQHLHVLVPSNNKPCNPVNVSPRVSATAFGATVSSCACITIFQYISE